MVKDGLDKIKESVSAHTGMKIDVVTRLDSDFGVSSVFGSSHDPLEDIINLPITQTE